MADSQHEAQIEEIATMLLADKISPDEQDEDKLKKYYFFSREQFHLDDEMAIHLVNEACLYLKLKNADSIDPLQNGDQFGAGFS